MTGWVTYYYVCRPREREHSCRSSSRSRRSIQPETRADQRAKESKGEADWTVNTGRSCPRDARTDARGFVCGRTRRVFETRSISGGVSQMAKLRLRRKWWWGESLICDDKRDSYTQRHTNTRAGLFGGFKLAVDGMMRREQSTWKQLRCMWGRFRGPASLPAVRGMGDVYLVLSVEYEVLMQT